MFISRLEKEDVVFVNLHRATEQEVSEMFVVGIIIPIPYNKYVVTKKSVENNSEYMCFGLVVSGKSVTACFPKSDGDVDAMNIAKEMLVSAYVANHQ